MKILDFREEQYNRDLFRWGIDWDPDRDTPWVMCWLLREEQLTQELHERNRNLT